MASQTQRLKRTAKFKKMVAYVKGMTDKEFKEMTFKVGIVTKSGTLAQKYRTVKKTKKKSAPV